MHVNNLIHYFSINWNSVTDGDGIRTVVYLQGCNLECPWCHSPHSQLPFSTILLNTNNCIFCGNCINECKQGVHSLKKGVHLLNYKKCISCGDCINSCPKSNSNINSKNALYLPTKKISSEKLFKKILPQLELLRKIGGLTLSGGEPLLQHKQIKDLLIRCKNDNIHTTIETSASVPFSFFENIYNEVDSWLFGIRPISNKYQGKLPDFNLVIDNLRKLSNLNNNNITIRTPIIQNVIDTQYQINQIIDIMRKNKLSRIELLPYNPYTNHYYSATGRKFKNNFYSVNNETMNIFQNQFNKRNINVKIMNIN